MKIVGRECLENFLTKNSLDRREADSWLNEALAAQWNSGQEITQNYLSASYIPSNTVIFKFNRSNCQIETKVSFNNKIVLIENVQSIGENVQKIY